MPDWGALDPELKTIALVALAMVLGSVLGIERELAHKPAGLRTHMLVAGAACLIVLLGDVVVSSYDATLPDSRIRSDPLRAVEAVITGVSFLGAGTIIRRGGEDVEGLTTAASLLFTAGVGIAVALSNVIVAVGATALVLMTLRAVGALSVRIEGRNQGRSSSADAGSAAGEG